ncbi:fluoride exporter [Methylomarinovum tepidoasis]|uniref:Fluoride-specific ion channel FluC n=1 Tax=Methylomarinovum tepidoasis TaxID=2840183 RepID=A0AAU9CJ61_9GAMM|nr:fluoride efflux transporter CrcB [Methylomarinovum sp. IN45]BCX89406.1 fluoride exporter [Methylomarinovum sp. IN45]
MTALQAVAIMMGGAAGALLRFLVSSGIYQWLGRDFPYGTLAVNVIGSFLIGLLSEGLLAEPVGRLAALYRPALLVGFLGAFTTFSTFSLETLNLIEQGQFWRALVNAVASVLLCLSAVALGVVLGRSLLLLPAHLAPGHWLPYGQLLLNVIGAFLIGFVFHLATAHSQLGMEGRALALISLLGVFMLASGLYLVFHLLERGHDLNHSWNLPLAVFLFNTLLCILAAWLGLIIGRAST